MISSPASAVILVYCPDRPGIVARVSGFVFEHGGNILDLDHHTDLGTGELLMRAEFSLEGLDLPPTEIAGVFRPLAESCGMRYAVHLVPDRPRVALLVSKQDHCLVDLLQRRRRGELAIEVPLIVSNHATCASWADVYGIPFHVVAVTPEGKAEQERQVLALLHRERIELVVLARYMQVLSAEFLRDLGCPVINIHHSFLPAFAGANPYRQAFERGVKLIGATAHYATEELDEGPIIAQDVVHVGHRDTLSDLVRKGRDLEELVLARAVRWHVEHRVLVYGSKTVVFE